MKKGTQNIRGLGHKEDDLDTSLYEKVISVPVITETKKKLKGTKYTKNYTVIYSGVNRNIRAQSEVMIWVHKTISNKIDYYKFWTDRIIEVTLSINRGYVTVIGLYAPEEGREELSNTLYDELQNVINKINENDYTLLIGDINKHIRNKKNMNIVGTIGEEKINNNGKKLIDLCTYNNLRIMVSLNITHPSILWRYSPMSGHGLPQLLPPHFSILCGQPPVAALEHAGSVLLHSVFPSPGRLPSWTTAGELSL
jgi:hypothetical protein